MLELMEKMIEDLKEKYYWEKHHKHSKIAKFAIKLCLKEAESGELEVTEEDIIDDYSLRVKYAVLWILKSYGDFSNNMGYRNDSMSFAFDQNIIDIASIYGSAYSRKYYGDIDRIKALKDDTYKKYIADDKDQIDVILILTTGEEEDDDDYEYFRPLHDLARLISHKLIEYRNSDIESMIYDNYTRILDNIIYGFDKADIEDKIKITEIFSLLYAIAKRMSEGNFLSTIGLYHSLPKYLMIYIYVLLNNYLADFYKSDVDMNLITGDIDKMDYKELEIIVEKASDCFDLNIF